MKAAYVITGTIVFVILIFIIYDSYDMSCIYNNCNDISYSNTIKVRCPPGDPLIKTYEDTKKITNKGFVNELMYKQESLENNVVFENKLIENNVPLNDNSCKLSNDLPIVNIHVSYLLHNNTSKLVI
jgi:hypothetical protein